MAATTNLPPEVIEIILLNLPTKSLLRFKSVCKLWNTMISDPIFVQNHHHRLKNSNSHNLFLSRFPLQRFQLHEPLSRELPLLKLKDGKFQTVQISERPDGSYEILCSCNGVVLLGGDSYQKFVLWNPSTRRTEKLLHRSFSIGSNFGLCHDPITDDFKVVIVAYNYYSLYSCKNESWTKRGENHDTIGHGLFMNNRVAVCVDGASYWVSSRPNNSYNSYYYHINVSNYYIVYFDPRDDEFKILQKPENIVDDIKPIYLVDLGGCLCLYCNGGDTNTVKIWTKEKGIDSSSWKEMVTIENVKTQISLFVPLCFVESKIVIQMGLVVYSPCENKFRKFEGTEGFQCFQFRLLPCLDSMFFPIEQNRPKKKRKLEELV